MNLDIQEIEGWTVLTPREKRLDAFVEDRFKKTLQETVAAGAERIVLDLSHVEFVDSSGLGAIVFCRHLIGKGGSVVLAAVQSGVERVLELTRLDQVFRVIESPEAVVDETL